MIYSNSQKKCKDVLIVFYWGQHAGNYYYSCSALWATEEELMNP